MPVLLSDARAATQVRIGWRTRLEPAWTFDLPAIAEAARALGVKWRVEVGCAEYANGHWGGMHSCERRAGAYVHRIRVKRTATAEDASRILWHELAHAMQNERDGIDAFRAGRKRDERMYPYDEIPSEVEARSWEGCARYEPLADA